MMNSLYLDRVTSTPRRVFFPIARTNLNGLVPSLRIEDEQQQQMRGMALAP